MFADRPWKPISLLQLGSGILIALGVASLIPVLVSSFVGTSYLSPQTIKDPAALAKVLTTEPVTNPVAREMVREADPATLQAIRELARAAKPRSHEPGLNALTNLLNRAMDNPALRSPALLASAPPRVAELARQQPQGPGELLRLNRRILEEHFPATLVEARHAREIPPAQARFYLFLAGNLSLHLGLIWALTRFLELEGIDWRSFLRGAAPRLGEVLLFAITVGVASTLAMLLVSGLSTRLLTLLDHKPQLQQPLVILQQAHAPLEKVFFAYVALVGAPFLEESLFRGVLYTFFRQLWTPRSAALASACLFGLVHADLEKFLPLTLFGLILAALHERTRTVVAPMLAHATFNTINFVLFLAAQGLTAGAPPS